MRKAKIFKKCLVYTLIGALTLSNVTPALAYDHLDKVDYDSNKNSIAEVHEEVNVTEDGTSQATVYAELGKEFTITVPKSLTLSGQTKSGTYTVSVEGDIAGTDKINVIPDETFTLNSSGLNGVTASINQDKISWMYNEITDNAVIGNGTIDAKDLTAGKWNGTFNFNINLEEGTGSGNTGNEEQSILTLSVDDEVAIGAEESLQVNAYLEGELANDLVDWNSNNENITVTDGLIKTKASVKVGDSATITVTAESPDTLSAMANTLNDLGIATVAMAEDDISIDFTVTIVDIEYSVDEINLKPGESIEVTAKIIPEEINGTVRWSQTAVSGLSLSKNGNKVTIYVADNMETGKSYNIVATYGDYSKTLTINIISDHEHNYKWEITTEPTCMEDGTKTYTCDCGDSYEEIIYADDEYHDYESEYKTTLEPTCTEVGYKTQYCSICTYALDEIELPATGHNYIETVTDATCTANGNKHYECDVCSDSYDETITSSGHTYEEDNYTIDKAATCEEAGSKSVHCEVCNAIIEGTSVEIEATGHSYPSFWTTEKEATCTEAGLEQRICVNDDCGKVETREVKATGHTEVIDAAKEATCTETGLTEGKHCSVCNEILVAQEETPAEHNYVETTTGKINSWTNTSNGTYAFTQDGTKWTSNNKAIKSSTATSTWTIVLEETIEYSFKYKVSSESKYDKLTINLDGTTIVNGISGAGTEQTYVTTLSAGTHTIIATYSKDGSGDKNDDCAYIILEDIGAIISIHECTNCKKEENHNYIEEIITVPSCTEDGVKAYTCICGNSYNESIPATGHTYTEENYTIDIEGTCALPGSKSIHCDACDTIIEGTSVEIKIEHNYPTEWVLTTESTCGEAGIEQRACINCGNIETRKVARTEHTITNNICTTCGVEVAPEGELANWSYSKNDADNTITLRYYKGTQTNVIVYGAYLLNGKVYNAKIESNNGVNWTDNYMFDVYTQKDTSNISNIKTITFNKGIDTSEATNMNYMFYVWAETNLTTINGLDNLDVSNVTSAESMFTGCTALQTINGLPHFTNGASIKAMFNGCESLTTIIGLNNIDTSEMTSLQSIFMECQSLRTLDLTEWDTSNITSMYGLFYGCKSLTMVKVKNGKWNMDNVKNTSYMYTNCNISSVTYVD